MTSQITPSIFSRTPTLPPARYWLMRQIRRAIPQPLIANLLDRGIYLTPGWDTRAPHVSLNLYEEAANANATSLKNSTVCILGYGGGFAVALNMLEFGAKHVVLQDPYAEPRKFRNAKLPAKRMEPYFLREGGEWVPKPEYITVTREPIEKYAQANPASCDFVVSSSVLEHVSGLDTVIPASAKLCVSGGLNIHIVDLRDHYFRYPFEMLCYTEDTWNRWLNASNNLNRWRLPQYETLFNKSFAHVHVEALESLREEFMRMKGRIRSEFLSGDDHTDSVARIRVTARAR